MRLARVQSAFGPVLDFSVSLSLVALVFIGGRMVIRGDVTVGTFVAFQQYVQMIIWPMIAVGIGINHFQRAAISTRRLSSFFDVPNPIVRSTTPELPKGFNPGPWKTPGAVSVRGLSFRYPSSDRPILSNVSFEIGAGERIGIMGPVGSGKTTLLYLLPRLYEVPKATIFVDGVDVNEWPLDVLRAQMGFVTQETFLFSDTIGHNIAFESEMNSMIEAASMASSFHQEVLAFDKRYETLLGERGVNLSGGQRQRLTIARALARDPSILLLDDSLSSVDVKTERLILDGLKNRPHRNTEIIAAHRVSTVEEADRVLVFIEGKILEIGTPKELRDRSTSYFSKLSIQQKMQEELKAKIEGVDVHV
jgi:ATP-binding cassette subfamily B protein